MPKIKLLAPISHDGKWLLKDAEITVTEEQAARLIDFNVAILLDKNANPSTPKKPPEDPISVMSKKECIAELTEAGVEFDSKAKLGELQDLVRELRSKHKGGLPDDNDELNPAKMDREELELALTERAIDFNSDDTDDALRDLLIEALESENE